MTDFGIFALLYRIARDILGGLVRILKREDPSERIARRNRLRAEFEANLHWFDNSERFGDAIIRDLRRADSYPDVKGKRRGISPWFRVQIVGLYHRGVEVGLRWTSVHQDPRTGELRLTELTGEERNLNLFVIGRIPFDRIVSVNWQGDEYYRDPHLYCRFTSRLKEPYEQVVLAEKVTDLERPFFREVADHMAVYKRSKRWGRAG